MSSVPYRELKSALSHYADVTGLRWNIHLTQTPGRHRQEETAGPARTIRLELTSADAFALATVLSAAADPGHGREPVNQAVPVLPEISDDDDWLTTAEVAKRIKVALNTINGWLARNSPKSCPFPRATRVNYRNYWQASVIDQWYDKWHPA